MRDDVLMAQRFDDGSLRPVGDAVPIAENVSYMKGWSRGVFTASDTDNLLFRIGTIVTGSQFTVYDDAGVVLDSIGEQQILDGFAISDDESRIAFDIEDQASSETDIWIYDMSRRTTTRFTFGPSENRYPTWSPDGEQIVYYSNNKNDPGLYVKTTFGVDTAQSLISFKEPGAPWDWSSDGKSLVYGKLSPDTKADIFLHTFEKSDYDSVYLKTEFFEWSARVSPDNRWLAYTSDESGKNEIYVSTFPRFQRKWQVSIKGGVIPRWSDDGRMLYYMDLDHLLKRVAVDGSGSNFIIGEITPMFKKEATGLSSYQVYNNGKRVLVNQEPDYTAISQCVHALNWTEELVD
jgi:Tol biopolymer transport system component